MNFVEKIALSIIFIVFVVVVKVMSIEIKRLNDEPKCLNMGYTKTVTDENYNSYCVKRVSGTDVLHSIKN